MNYTHEIVGTHGGALLQQRVPGAKPFMCIGLYVNDKKPNAYQETTITILDLSSSRVYHDSDGIASILNSF